MKSVAPYSFIASITWILAPSCTHSSDAFVTSRTSLHSAIIHRHHHHPAASTRLKSIAPDEPANNDNEDDRVQNELGLDIIRGSDVEISDEIWGDVEGGAPSRWMVMKNLLGINIFTYILAAVIIIFLSMNAVFGPGWLGQSLGWENVGTFTKVSDSLPLEVDVSGPEYLL
mmetsp:Transcript_25306/g.54461  ORF Transcript_25306/g.54461 Transcript_25306/m.54461 type:complete len:171 (-) Transcript_25306:230-742(-)|eukprot:CAMPEP_0172311924 /NCGR_PEP_ID=MMETSP1058-20130122/16087_1 /TAXON_ID=83371 /ORGANISM="Detonula confervacea, Strain CCMP 353" /LENGTH=170 /DNA_ID=CAMNT_0013025237 /DNA_START=34 /DNA_END=546 /DNA_ORIENTATION=-